MPEARQLEVKFFCTQQGDEPVRKFLKELSSDERKIIGQDIKTVQLKFPIGKPTVDYLRDGLWEVRSSLENRIARVIFFIEEGKMVLVHGFIKKTQKTSEQDIDLAKSRKNSYLRFK